MHKIILGGAMLVAAALPAMAADAPAAQDQRVTQLELVLGQKTFEIEQYKAALQSYQTQMQSLREQLTAAENKAKAAEKPAPKMPPHAATPPQHPQK